jgi:aspartyl-tRNA(Asn)/glutamyl-tRNA(Gln) amidotransferase subunit A
MVSEDVLFSSVRSLGQAIRTRQLSPVALTEAYLARLESIGPKLGAVVTITRDLALSQAKIAEREIAAGKYRGPLHGIPYGSKDALAVKGYPTTWGTAPYKNQTFDYNATVINRLEGAGAILLGKLAMLETVGGFGFNSADASFTGPGRTPWNLNHWSGGSSSGPGAATAAGCVAFAIGSETGGSILNPSTYCGLAGIRPTYGRVSRHGVVALSWTLDKVGPMCRSADDCGLVLSVIAGQDKLDGTTSARRFSYDGSNAKAKRRYKLAVAKGTYENVQPEVRSNFENSLKVLSDFADIEHDIQFPDYPYGQIIGLIIAAEGASAFRDLTDTGTARQLQNQTAKITGYADAVVSAVDYLQAQRVRKRARLAMDEVLQRYDAIVAPTMNSVSRRVDENWDPPRQQPSGGSRNRPQGFSLLPAGNIGGIPGITVPNGFGQQNLPTGVQFVGAAWSERTLIEIAHAYQERTDWHHKRPPITA